MPDASRQPRSPLALLLAVIVGVILVTGLVTIYLVEPAETVTTDLGRLYSDGLAEILGGSLFVLIWVSGAIALTVVAVRALGRSAGVARSVAIITGLVGFIALSALVAAFPLGFTYYFIAEDGGYAPLSGSHGTVLGVFAGVGTALLVVAAGASLVALVRHRTATA
ncbi:hypothetical protein [Agromyces lapidis]|uniref:Uncharacterized protein n=1 Tax=Agromyces lapidis TaxID=279574 RepID=A0ABV5SNS0_9MICO|nr:hypothetical protein [Agromyces lapidis]